MFQSTGQVTARRSGVTAFLSRSIPFLRGYPDVQQLFVNSGSLPKILSEFISTILFIL